MRRLLLSLSLFLIFIPDSSSREPVSSSTFRTLADNGAPLPTQDEMERLVQRDPIAFLKACIHRYDREVEGFTATLQKQERIDGSLERGETIEIAFREDPFSVLMKWKEGARRAKGTLFLKGENKGQILVRPAGLLSVAGVVQRDPNGPDAKKGGRYPLTEFGIKIGMERTLTSWEKAKKDNALHVEYLGSKRIQEAGDRTCWVLRRTGYRKPEEDGITQLTIYVDKETWLQVGSILTGSEGRLIGEYYFRDIQLNPDFKPDTFTPEALKR